MAGWHSQPATHSKSRIAHTTSMATTLPLPYSGGAIRVVSLQAYYTSSASNDDVPRRVEQAAPPPVKSNLFIWAGSASSDALSAGMACGSVPEPDARPAVTLGASLLVGVSAGTGYALLRPQHGLWWRGGGAGAMPPPKPDE